MTTTPTTYETAYDFADAAPDFAAPIANCWNWAHNFTNFDPMKMLLDLVGYSHDELGAPLHNWDAAPALGSYDLGVLADALTAWANRPTDCEEWTRTLLELETRD